MDNEEIILSYAASPKVNQGWMKADKPWQFLAACFELMKFRLWQMEHDDLDCYDYESHLECYIDGSNNGSQHLSALTRDEITAPHVNLVPLDLPGDLYKYVGDHVWKHLEEVVSTYSKEDIKELNEYIDTIIEYKKQISAAEPKSLTRASLVEDIKLYKAAYEHLAGRSSPLFWLRIRDAKQRRKVVKR